MKPYREMTRVEAERAIYEVLGRCTHISSVYVLLAREVGYTGPIHQLSGNYVRGVFNIEITVDGPDGEPLTTCGGPG